MRSMGAPLYISLSTHHPNRIGISFVINLLFVTPPSNTYGFHIHRHTTYVALILTSNNIHVRDLVDGKNNTGTR